MSLDVLLCRTYNLKYMAKRPVELEFKTGKGEGG
jgi:hypothetical protein